MANGETGVAQSVRASSLPAGSSSPAVTSPPPGSSPSPAGSHAIVRYGPPIIIGLLLAAVIAGIRAAGPAVAGRGPWRQDALAVGVSLEVALAAVQIALVVRTRRSPDPGPLASMLRQLLRQLTLYAMIVIIVIAAVNVVAPTVHSNLLRILTAHPKRSSHAVKHVRLGRPLASVDESYILYTVLALVVLAAVAICLVAVSRARKRIPGGYAAEVAGDESDELRRAVESGAAALQAVDDARAAIISCYVAMEGSLAGAGAARKAAETPDELLTRAVASGLIHGPAAPNLTALFYEARFSTHRLADGAKDEARQALDAISAELQSKLAAVRQLDSARADSAQPDSPRHSSPGGSQPTGRAR